MSAKIITITREFGSGGRTIGRQVADALGYDFYDWEIVSRIAKESEFAEEFIEENGEDATSTSSFLFRFNKSGNDLMDRLYIAQRKLINELAEKGNCVIVGRCADYILRDRTDVLNVFVWANEEFKKDRIVNLYGEREQSIEKRLKEKDGKRKAYYQYYTGRKWGRAWYYQVCLESSRIGVDRCSEIVVDLAKNFNN